MPWIDWPGRRTEEDALRRMTMPFEQAAAWGQGRFDARGDFFDCVGFGKCGARVAINIVSDISHVEAPC